MFDPSDEFGKVRKPELSSRFQDRPGLPALSMRNPGEWTCAQCIEVVQHDQNFSEERPWR